MTAIELNGVSKRYGDVLALQEIDLSVERGEVFGFLGPNGAGKSTTIDLLLDYLSPTSGSVTVLGHDAQHEPVAVRRETGILPESYSPMKRTTGREHVEFAIAARNAADDPAAVLERVDLLEDADRPATEYSKGMTQRMALGMALVGEPGLLILDEPSSGLDPHGVRLMREIVDEERERGATVFFSSHILEQVEAVADRVGILDEGRLVEVDTIDGLRSNVGGTGQLSVTLDRSAENVEATVESLADVSLIGMDGDTITVACPDDRKAAVVDAVRTNGAEILDFRTSETSLEDLFVEHTGGTA